MAAILALAISLAAHGQVAIYPPLTTEISAEHPLFLFRVAPPVDATTGGYAQFVIDAWQQLPDSLKPFSALTVNVTKPDEVALLLQPLQDAGVPLVLRASAGGRTGRQDLAQLESVISAYTTIRGIEPRGMRLDVYDGPDDAGDIASANAAWINGAIDAAAKYGRFVHWPLTGLDAARFMAHPGYASARAKMIELNAYVLPSSVQRGDHIAQGNAACMGLWLGGMAGAWGVCADPNWYAEARLVSPGTIGKAATTKAPPTLYRAMVLAGALGGAWVYSFDVSGDLWFNNPSPDWNDAIAPVLGEVMDLGLTARKEFVTKAAPLAFQLIEAGNPVAFHRNLHDLSPSIDAGVLWRAAFGGSTGPVPSTDNLALLPILPLGAPAEALAQFKTVIQADDTATLEQRQAVVDAAHTSAGDGKAFIAEAGRGLYVFNTDLAAQTPQDYSLAELPAAVRGLEARREGDGVTLTWPFREGDVSYTVYKRISPQLKFTALTRGTEERRYSDPSVPSGDTVSYAVTALTNEKEPLKGTVNFGDFLVFSVVESRIAEEALLTPVLTEAKAQPFAGFNAPPLASPGPRDGLDDAQTGIAKAIEERLAAWKKAFEAEDLGATVGIYADEYEDPQGWRVQYVKSTYQAFFERCATPRMDYQIRKWDFSTYATSGQVNVLLYCSLRGNVVSDASGRNADQAIEIPRTDTNEVLISFTGSDGVWRVQRTDPPVPNLNELLPGSGK